MADLNDREFMARALRLARLGLYTSSPNPRVGCVLVRDGRLFGVITDGDLRRNMATLMQSTPSEIANRTPVTVPADYLAAEALALLNERKVSALLVLDQNETPVGVLHMHDFLRAGVM